MEALTTVRNATQEAKQFASSQAGQLARIEGLVVVCCLLSSILVLGNSRRRHESRWFPRLIVWASFLFNYPVVAYTIGAMQSSSIQNELFVVWACFLILLLGSADCMTAFNFDDTSQQMRSMMNQGLHIIYLLLLILNYKGQLGHTLLISLILLWALSTLRLGLRAWAYRSTRRSHGLIQENHVVADYMFWYNAYRSKRYESGRYDPKDIGIMNLTHFLVDGEEKNGGKPYDQVDFRYWKTVDVGRVWDCEGKLLADSKGGRGAASWRRDLCLSFALFKMLKLNRFGGLVDCGQDVDLVQTQTFRNIVIHDLLSDDKRAFRVLEAELGFLFDFFYIRHPLVKDTLAAESIVYATILATSVFTLFSPNLVKYHRPSSQHAAGGTNVFVHGFNLDLLITRLVIVCYISIESYQFLAFFVFSNWHKVGLMCQYVRKWHDWPLVHIALKLLCHPTSTRYWKGTLDQCFLLENAHEPHWFKRFLLWTSLQSLEKSLTTSSVTLHPEINKAILRELKKSKGHIHNVVQQLRVRSGTPLGSIMDGVRYMNHTGLILTFHLATSICSYALDKEKASEEVRKNHDVANQLSGYCAYLMAFQPELLSGSAPLDSLSDVRFMMNLIRELLGNCRFNEDEKYGKLIDILTRDIGGDACSHLLRYAAEIAVCLNNGANYDENQRWQELASLWANVILYIAPSDRAVVHASKMASGGEYITIIWALLTHAGILEVPSSTSGSPTDPAEEDDNMETDGELTFQDIVKLCYPHMTDAEFSKVMELIGEAPPRQEADMNESAGDDEEKGETTMG